MKQDFGPINGHLIGIVMKELVRRATAKITAERIALQVTGKQGRTGIMDDFVTSADLAAQQVIVRSLREGFPDFGIVAEEDELSIPCQVPDHKIYFTVDPMDGTKAAVRGQSHGISTMISLVYDNEVVAAFIGDINTEEIYGFRPGSDKVHRISHLDHVVQLKADGTRQLGDQYLLLRDPVTTHSAAIQALINSNCFKAHEIEGGSIGTWMARLWKGEVGGGVLSPGIQNPWDIMPIFGISKKMGFLFLEVDPTLGNTKVFDPLDCLLKDPIIRAKNELLIIHESQWPVCRRFVDQRL